MCPGLFNSLNRCRHNVKFYPISRLFSFFGGEGVVIIIILTIVIPEDGRRLWNWKRTRPKIRPHLVITYAAGKKYIAQNWISWPSNVTAKGPGNRRPPIGFRSCFLFLAWWNDEISQSTFFRRKIKRLERLHNGLSHVAITQFQRSSRVHLTRIRQHSSTRTISAQYWRVVATDVPPSKEYVEWYRERSSRMPGAYKLDGNVCKWQSRAKLLRRGRISTI